MSRKGTHNVKFITKKLDKNDSAIYTRIGNGVETTYGYYRQRERLQAMQLTANVNSIIQTQK